MPDDHAVFDKLANLDPGEYLIEKQPNGEIHADRLDRRVIVEPHRKGTRIFHRNAIKLVPNVGQVRSRWLVIEHAKTRIYFNAQVVIVTDRDLYP